MSNLIESFLNLLFERESPAAALAKKAGLVSKGVGLWGPPGNTPATHSTRGGKFVPVAAKKLPTGSKGTPTSSPTKSTGRPPSQPKSQSSIPTTEPIDKPLRTSLRQPKPSSVQSRPSYTPTGEADAKLGVLNRKIPTRGSSAKPGGSVHEVAIGFIMDMFNANPNLKDREVVAKLFPKFENTELGKQVRDNLKSLLHSACDSARVELDRIDIGIKTNEMNPKTSTSAHYHGNLESAKLLKIQMEKLTSNGYVVSTTSGIHIHPTDFNAMIDGAGMSTSETSMETPGDSFILTIDPKTKQAVFSTSGNKTKPTDQSLNTTVLKELKDYRKTLGEFIETGILSTHNLIKVEGQLNKIDEVLDSLANRVTDSFKGPVDMLHKNSAPFKQWVTDIENNKGKKASTEKNIPAYYQECISKYLTAPQTANEIASRESIIQKYRDEIKTIKGNPIKMASLQEKIRKTEIALARFKMYREAFISNTNWKEGSKITPKIAEAAWINHMKLRLNPTWGKKADVGLSNTEKKLVSRYSETETAGNIGRAQLSVISDIKRSALDAIQTRHELLSKINCTIDGKTMPVSQAILGLFVVHALHLEEALSGIPGINKQSVYVQYSCFYKSVTGKLIHYPESIRKTLKVSRFVDLAENLSISKPHIADKRSGEEGDVGSAVYDIVFSGVGGEKLALLKRWIRTKGGTALEITVNPEREYTDGISKYQPKSIRKTQTENVLQEDSTTKNNVNPSYYERFKGIPPEILNRELTYNPIDPATGRLRIDKKTGAPKISHIKLSNVLFTPSKYEKYPALLTTAHSMAAPYLDKDDEEPEEPEEPLANPTMATAPSATTPAPIVPTPPPATHQIAAPTKIGHVFPANHHAAFKNKFAIKYLKHITPYKNEETTKKHLALLMLTVLLYFKKHKKTTIQKYFGNRDDLHILKRLAKQIVESFPTDEKLISATVDTLDRHNGDLIFHFENSVIRIMDFDGFAEGMNIKVEGGNVQQRIAKLMSKLLPTEALQQPDSYYFVHDILAPTADLSLIGSSEIKIDNTIVIYCLQNINPTDLLIGAPNDKGNGYTISLAKEFAELLDIN